MLKDLTSIDQIASQLAITEKKEAELVFSLNALVSDRSGIDLALTNLQALGRHVEQLCADMDDVSPPFGSSAHGLGGHAPGLLERIERVYLTSERVGGKVRKLDLEIGRVKGSIDMVSEVMDLKVRGGVNVFP